MFVCKAIPEFTDNQMPSKTKKWNYYEYDLIWTLYFYQ